MKAKANDNEMEIVEPGLHKARCIRVIDRGTHKSERYGNYSHQLMIMFELPETEITEGEAKGQPFSVCIFPNLTIGEKSNLRKYIVGWLGRGITAQEEEDGFDVMSLLDKTAYLNIIHNESNGQTYANVASISPLKDEECPARINDLQKFDLDNFDQAEFDALSEKMQEYIKLSREWPHRLKDVMPGEIEQATHQAEMEATFGNQDVHKPELDDAPQDFFEYMLCTKETLKNATGDHSFFNNELKNKFDIQLISQVKGEPQKQAEIRAYFGGLLEEITREETAKKH